jgi:hypothetical protein
MEGYEELIGKTVEEAKAEHPAMRIRVMKLDGKGQIGTADYRTDRINVAVEDGIITEVLNIG